MSYKNKKGVIKAEGYPYSKNLVYSTRQVEYKEQLGRLALSITDLKMPCKMRTLYFQITHTHTHTHRIKNSTF